MKTPVRQCAACRGHFDKKELIRVVRRPDGTVAVDDKGKMPGRGVYICKKSECLKRALKQDAFSHALGVKVPPETEDEISLALQEGQNG